MHRRYIKSGRFSAGRHSWRIIFFPNGVHLYFQVMFTCGNHMPSARAIARFTLLPRDGDGKPLTITRDFDPRWEDPINTSVGAS